MRNCENSCNEDEGGRGRTHRHTLERNVATLLLCLWLRKEEESDMKI